MLYSSFVEPLIGKGRRAWLSSGYRFGFVCRSLEFNPRPVRLFLFCIFHPRSLYLNSPFSLQHVFNPPTPMIEKELLARPNPKPYPLLALLGVHQDMMPVHCQLPEVVICLQTAGTALQVSKLKPHVEKGMPTGVLVCPGPFGRLLSILQTWI